MDSFFRQSEQLSPESRQQFTDIHSLSRQSEPLSVGSQQQSTGIHSLSQQSEPLSAEMDSLSQQSESLSAGSRQQSAGGNFTDKGDDSRALIVMRSAWQEMQSFNKMKKG